MIGTEYKRTAKELLSRYILEPKIKDLYVEGPDDKAIFANYIRHRSLSYEVYPIETVDTTPLFDQTNNKGAHVENKGNKERVEKLSDFFEKNMGPREQCIFCICDRDHDAFIGEKTNNSYLKRTDFASIESYAFEERVFNKFFPILLHEKAPSGKQAIIEIYPAVQFLFLVRITRYVINNSWIPVEISKAISFDKKGASSFGIEEYLTKMTSDRKNQGVSDKRQEFIKQFNDFKNQSSSFDYRYVMHGHDFSAVVNLYLKEKGIERVSNSLIEKTLFLSIEAEDLDQYNLFNELAQCNI